MHSHREAELELSEHEGTGGIAVDESLEVESIELRAPSTTDLSALSVRQREEMQRFLVACFQASVSIESMSRYLGIDTDTVRSELRHGIEAWNANQSRVNRADTTLTIAA